MFLLLDILWPLWGILTLEEQETENILKILVAADELLLQEIVEYYLNWKRVEQYFELVHQTSFDRNNFAEIQQFCTELMEKSLEKNI